MSSHNKNNTEIFYKEIINKVCDRVKEEFLNEGVAEDVLSELKKVTDVNKMNYPLINPQNLINNNLNKNPQLMDNQFKSDPNKTTIDNCKLYLEQKNLNVVSETKSTQNSSFNPNELPANNEIYRGGYEETDQHISMNIMKNMPNNIIGNIRKNSGNINGVSADDESSDSDHEYFKKNEPKKEDVEEKQVNDDDEESLSSLSNESDHIVVDSKDYLLAQYEKVHRVRNKWKCIFKDAILHINGKEHVFDRVNAELERDW